MSEEEAPLEDARRERFCQFVASGLSQAEAYRQAGYSENGANGNAAALIANHSVSARVAALRHDIEARIEMTRVEYLARLAAIFRGDIEAEPEQIRAAELLARAQKWNEPETDAVS